MKRYCIWIVAALLLTSCAKKESKQENRTPITVTVMAIDSMTGGLTRTYVGEVEENLSVAMSFATGGKVRSLRVKNGDYVSAGQLLVSVDNTSALNAYNTAKASLKQAEDAYQRLKKVYEQGSLPEVKWVEMLTNLDKARSMEQIAKKQLDDCSLYAPISGVVNGCDCAVGSTLLPGEAAMNILDMKQVAVTFTVPESEIATALVGHEARVQVPALDDLVLTGKISEQSLTANRLSHSYTLKIALPNSDKKLLPGMVCKVLLEQPNTEGIIIPAKMVQTRPEGLSVWVLHNGRAERRLVQSTEFVANGVLVSGGLHYGDTVITGGYEKLYTGAAVKVVEL